MIMDNCIYRSIYDSVRASFTPELRRDPALISPVTLAYIGDTVYDLFVRSYIVTATDYTAGRLHSAAVSMVCAGAQAYAFSRIRHLLSEEELDIFKRGRNAHSNAPKSCSQSEYRTATGLEALFGYLFLKGEDLRMAYLMKNIFENIKTDNANGGNTNA